ncbi:MAG: DnaJ domain-containing protein [Polaromonas sp.]|uniref:DnaJ domain-containing protein n=1 Tax=Polaromonas sp. TaxID=1869339 RepID=UPI0025DD120A|nr:DnaJ domain-containing protein [Polaromonas sp.]MBI2725545.1 DnaJ domain-containing protein [Polaromonas sp.]
MKDHYAALGLSSAARLADIKKAFRQQASLFHPDRNPDPQAPARFRAVQEAYDVLSDDTKRQAYDDNRRRNLLDSPIDTAREIWQTYFNRLI